MITTLEILNPVKLQIRPQSEVEAIALKAFVRNLRAGDASVEIVIETGDNRPNAVSIRLGNGSHVVNVN